MPKKECDSIAIVTRERVNIEKLFKWKTQRYNGQGEDSLPHLDYDISPGLKHIPFYGDNKAVIGALTGETKADCLPRKDLSKRE